MFNRGENMFFHGEFIFMVLATPGWYEIYLFRDPGVENMILPRPRKVVRDIDVSFDVVYDGNGQPDVVMHDIKEGIMCMGTDMFLHRRKGRFIPYFPGMFYYLEWDALVECMEYGHLVERPKVIHVRDIGFEDYILEHLEFGIVRAWRSAVGVFAYYYGPYDRFGQVSLVNDEIGIGTWTVDDRTKEEMREAFFDRYGRYAVGRYRMGNDAPDNVPSTHLPKRASVRSLYIINIFIRV